MSWLVAIDESGDLGKDSRFFVMAAIIVRRANNLKQVSKVIPRSNKESKYYNSSENTVGRILAAFAESEVRIVNVVVDKHDHKQPLYGKCGNDLYQAVLSELLDAVSALLTGSELHILLDMSSFIQKKDLVLLANDIVKSNGCFLHNNDKVISEQSNCIQIADFIAGTIFRCFEKDK